MDFTILSFENDIWIALALFMFVWLYAWAKGALGSAKLGILFALIISYVTFYTYRELVWIVVILFLFATFGREIFSKMNVFSGGGVGGVPGAGGH